MEITAKRAIEIMHQLQNNNDQNFHELCQACEKYLKGISYNKNYRFWPEWEREDYCNEVMLEVWNKRNQYDEKRGAFTTWLSQIESSVYNKAYNKRKKWNIISMFQRDEDNNDMNIVDMYASSGSCEDEVISNDTCERIMDELDNLPVHQKAVFQLCCIDQIKPAQVAEMLGCKIQDVSNWKKRAMDKMTLVAERELWEMEDSLCMPERF